MQSASRYLITITAIAALVTLALVFALIRFYSAPRADTSALSSAASFVPSQAAKSLPKPDPRHLPNFAVVAPGIYRGAAPTADGWKRLRDLGIRTEIDLRIERRGRGVAESAAKKHGIERIHLPMGREAPTPKQVETFLATLNDPAKHPVFVHCQHGADRTGAMIGIYRETNDGWDFPRTYAEMRRYGFKPFLTELKGAVKKRAPKI